MSTTSCVIPCYNASATIANAVQSVVNQTHEVSEIIIVDDGSDIETKKVLEELTRKHSFVQIFTQENKGVSVARNVGISHSKGDYVLLLDADDTFDARFLERAIPIIESDNTIAMVMCYYRICKEGHTDILRKLNPASFKDYLFRNYGMATGLYSKKALQSIGGYDENMLEGYEDWELLIHLKKEGWEFMIIPEFLYSYNNLPESRNKNALLKDRMLKEYLFKKYKEDYINHYDDLITHFNNLIEDKQRTINKRENSLEFRIGRTLLYPLRKIKSWI